MSGRQAEIREAALRRFYERGYHATSLKEIARDVDLRAPSLYNHIDSKQRLLQDIMFEGIESLISEVQSAIAGADSILDKIRLGAEAHIRHHAQRRIAAHVNTYEIPALEEPARTNLLRRRRDYAHMWRTLVETGVREGVCLTDNPKLAAFALIDLGAGVARWFRPDGEIREDGMIAFYGDLALRIVGAHVPAGAGVAESAALRRDNSRLLARSGPEHLDDA
jgi:AcrR family transcriptional regulator